MSKILIVEDDPTLAEMEKTLLESMGHRGQVASSAEEALEMIGRQKPDALLIDVCLPGRDGYALAQKLRATISTEHIPFAFISGRVEDIDVGKGFRSGGVFFLAKPFNVKALKIVVESLLRVSASDPDASRRAFDPFMGEVAPG